MPLMAIIQLVTSHWPRAAYDQVTDRLDEAGVVAHGRIVQVCFGSPDNFQLVSVWDSQESSDRHVTTALQPLFDEYGLDRSTMEVQTYEVHKLLLSPHAPEGRGVG